LHSSDRRGQFTNAREADDQGVVIIVDVTGLRVGFLVGGILFGGLVYVPFAVGLD